MQRNNLPIHFLLALVALAVVFLVPGLALSQTEAPDIALPVADTGMLTIIVGCVFVFIFAVLKFRSTVFRLYQRIVFYFALMLVYAMLNVVLFTFAAVLILPEAIVNFPGKFEGIANTQLPALLGVVLVPIIRGVLIAWFFWAFSNKRVTIGGQAFDISSSLLSFARSVFPRHQLQAELLPALESQIAPDGHKLSLEEKEKIADLYLRRLNILNARMQLKQSTGRFEAMRREQQYFERRHEDFLRFDQFMAGQKDILRQETLEVITFLNGRREQMIDGFIQSARDFFLWFCTSQISTSGQFVALMRDLGITNAGRPLVERPDPVLRAIVATLFSALVVFLVTHAWFEERAPFWMVFLPTAVAILSIAVFPIGRIARLRLDTVAEAGLSGLAAGALAGIVFEFLTPTGLDLKTLATLSFSDAMAAVFSSDGPWLRFGVYMMALVLAVVVFATVGHQLVRHHYWLRTLLVFVGGGIGLALAATLPPFGPGKLPIDVQRVGFFFLVGGVVGMAVGWLKGLVEIEEVDPGPERRPLEMSAVE